MPISKDPSNLDAFPVPVAGQAIPRGWFSRLVVFINSLVLHGNRYLAVSHTMSGTRIEPTEALLQLASGGGAAPSGGGGTGGDAFDISAVTAHLFNANSPYTAVTDGWLSVWSVASIPAGAPSGGGECGVTLAKSGTSAHFPVLSMSSENVSGVLDKTASGSLMIRIAAGTSVTVGTLAVSGSTVTATCIYYS